VAAKKWYQNAPLIEHPNKGLQLTPRKGSLQENRRTAVARTTSLLGTVINPCPSSGIDLLDRYYAVLVCRMIYQGERLASQYRCCNIAISNNVGRVKHFSSTLRRALEKKRHFALADGLRFPIEGSLVILAVRNSVRPNHLFDHNRDHDYYFELPGIWEWHAQSLRR
jgi:hypothetical protein